MTRNAEVEVDVSSAFVDPDGNPLSYGVSSSGPTVAAAQASGARVTLTAADEGTAAIRVTATDPGGLSATQAFSVTVAAMRVPFTDDPIVPEVTPDPRILRGPWPQFPPWLGGLARPHRAVGGVENVVLAPRA